MHVAHLAPPRQVARLHRLRRAPAAAFAFPLQLGGIRLGASPLYLPGNSVPEVVADAALPSTWQYRWSQPQQNDGRPGVAFLPVCGHGHPHARGAVAQQPGRPVPRLRARAFATDRSLLEVARDAPA